MHPGGFSGYRVVVTIAGDYRQRYFGKDQAEAARKLNRAWLRDQATWRQENPPELGAPSATVVVGIRLAFAAERNGRRTPALKLGIRIAEKDIRRTRHLTPTLSTLPGAWSELTGILAGYRTLGHRPRRWVQGCPTPDDFERLAAFLRTRGERINPECMAWLRQGW